MKTIQELNAEMQEAIRLAALDAQRKLKEIHNKTLELIN